MRTRLRRVGGSLMFLAATFIAAPFATSQGEPLAERVRQSRSLIPVIGHWTRGADSAMTVDGSNLFFETNENDNTREAIYLLNKAGCP